MVKLIVKPEVFRPGCHWLYCTGNRALSPDETKFTLLLCQEITTPNGRAPTYYHRMPGLQGRLGSNYCAHDQVNQGGYIDL